MKNFALLLLISLGLTTLMTAQQATLSLQGIIKNADGSAVEDGTYEITFNLYPDANSASVWTETQTDVDVKGGIYSALLGSVSGLPSFRQSSYLLGVSIEGGIELQPRSQLTAAPFALSLIGDDNIFPNDGNVGIGTTSPSTNLEVDGTAKVTDLEVGGTVEIDNKMSIGNATTAYALAVKGLAGNSNWLEFIDAGGSSEWLINHKGGGLNFAETGIADYRLYLDDGGNVGIGTDDPLSKLHIIGGSDAGLSGDGYVMYGTKTGTNMVIDNNEIMARDDSHVSTLNLNYDGGHIGLGNSKSMSHRVGVGTSSPNARGKLHVWTNSLSSTEWSIYLTNNDTNLAGGIKLSNNGFLRLTNNAQSSNPTYAALDNGGNWSSSSDRRLKENIITGKNFLKQVVELRPVYYNFKSLPKEDVDLGFIAQEVQEILPELVTGEETEEEFLSLNYDRFGVVAIGAIQEQQEIIEAQNKRIENLENRLKDLEKMMVMSASK